MTVLPGPAAPGPPGRAATVGALRALAADVDTTPRPLTVEETHVNILDAMQAVARSRTAT